MPWLPLANNAAIHSHDAVLFSEHLFPISGLKGFTDRYHTLSAEQLISFYRNESPLKIELFGKLYVLPLSVCAQYSDNSLSLVLCKKNDIKYSVPEVLTDYTTPILNELKKDNKSHDGAVTRLASFEDNVCVLQEASYFDGVATNFAIDHLPIDRTETLRQYLHSNSHSLGGLRNNSLVNHVGMVCMIETSDGKLIIQKRGSDVSNRAGTLSSSVSGAIDWSDIYDKDTPFPIEDLAESILRETSEELNISIDKVVYLGLLREYLRGGKPELYFFAKTHSPFHAVYSKWRENAKDRHESSSLIEYDYHSNRLEESEFARDSFQQRVEWILTSINEDANLTLVAGIIMTTSYLLEHCSHD